MRKKLKKGKNLLVLSKSLLVTTARTWDSLKFSASQKVFNMSKFWLFWVKDFWIWEWNSFMRKWQHIKLSDRVSLFSQWDFFLHWNSLITNTTLLRQLQPKYAYSLFANKKGVYLLNAGIKAYLFYGEKIQCNTGASIVSSWKPMYTSVLNMTKVYKV